MTTFWFWVGVGCAASAVCGYLLMRFAVPRLPKFRAVAGSGPVWNDMEEAAPAPVQVAATPPVRRERPPQKWPEIPARAAAQAPRAKRRPVAARHEATRRAAGSRVPTPTVREPAVTTLILWAREVEAGERTTSLATDGCRITWDRTCMHGHPSWLVQLGYLQRARAPLQRHTPR